jgi:SPX domain protein involved in polyphosphate accumulation
MNSIVRFERKFIVINKNISYLENLLRTSKFNFKEDYPSRKVNSIYFDDQNLSSVVDNLDGNNFKQKIRIRWYGDKKIISSPTLEIKKKVGHVNYKKNHKIKNFKPMAFKSENFNQLLKGQLKKKIPVSSTHYTRLYFISSKNNIRATIDSNINYFNLQKFSNYNLNNYSKPLILEIKYASEEDAYVRYLLKNINLRLNKNSKYINSLVENPFKIL